MKKFLFCFLLLCGISSVFANNEHHEIAYLAHSTGYWQVWVMDQDGNNKLQVTHSAYDKSRVSWYPDGAHLLVSGSQGALNKVDINTGNETPIKSEFNGMYDAVLSPNGKKIAFSVSAAGKIDGNDIWVFDSNGKNQKRVSKMKLLQHEPVWSADSEEIYFLSVTGKQTHDIWKVNLKSGSKEKLTDDSLYHFDIALSHNDDLAFSNNQTGNYEIWVMKNGKSKQVTNNPALDAKPSWSPNSNTLVFESNRDGVSNLWAVHLSSSDLKQLTNHKEGARAPVWFHSLSEIEQ